MTWSSGSKIDSDTVAKAFKLEDKKDLLKRGDAGPDQRRRTGIGCGTIIVLFFIVLILLLVVKACRRRRPGLGGTGGLPQRRRLATADIPVAAATSSVHHSTVFLERSPWALNG